MSNQCTGWAYRCRVGNAAAKAVLVYLADRADDDGTGAWPKVSTICQVTEYGERSVRNSLKYLEEYGFIRRGDQRHAALASKGRTRPRQYRAVVWDLCVERDPEILDYLEHTHGGEHDETSVEPVPVPDATDMPVDCTDDDVESENVDIPTISRGAPDAPLENGEGQGCTSCTSRGASGAPLYKPPVNNHPSPLKGPPEGDAASKDDSTIGQANALCSGIVALMLRSPRLPVPVLLDDGHGGISGRELDAATRLVSAYGLERCLAVARWVFRPEPNTGRPGGFSWRSVVTGPRKLLQKWDKIVAQMACDPVGISMLAPLEKTSVEQHRALLVSSEHRVRVPVYGAAKFGTPAAQGHLEGRVPVDGCPLCIFDDRNRATHGNPDAFDSPDPVDPQPAPVMPVDPVTGRPLSRFKGSRNYVGDEWMRDHGATSETSDGAEGGDRDE